MPHRNTLRFPALCLAVAGLFATVPARADAGASLERAEAAYAAVDFDAARSLARDALAAGGNEPADTLRLYTLLGIAASALGDEDAARDAFRRVIALDPTLRLDKTLSPKIRSPFLETRGQLTARGDIHPLGAQLSRKGDRLELVLDDPAGIVHVIDVSYRVAPERTFTSAHLAPRQSRFMKQPPRAGELEYVLVLRDAHGNALFRRGTESEPVRLSFGAREDANEKRPQPARADNGSYYLTAGLLAGAGVAAGGVGAFFHVRREQAASEWNGAGCEQPGGTRGTQCSGVDERRESSERLAIGLYAGAGALLVGSLVTLLITPDAEPRSRKRASVPCVPSVAPAGATCGLSF
jgi:hypothetical protein